MTSYIHPQPRRTPLNLNAKAVIRSVLFLGVVSYLFYRISLIGWSEVSQSLPTNPLFYFLSFALFIVPVLAEMSAFKVVTLNSLAAPLKVFARKHVLNKAVLTYSGEAYLIHELSDQEDLTVKKAATIIKDLAIVRTFVANLWVIILALAAIALGKMNTLQNIVNTSPALVIAVSFMSIAACSGVLVFFKKLSNLNYGIGARVAGIFLLRSFVIAGIMVLQSSLAIPGTLLSTWMIFIVVFFIARKSPIGGEMVFIGVALTLPGLHTQSASVAAMLVSLMALNQLCYLLAFFVTGDFNSNRGIKTSK